MNIILILNFALVLSVAGCSSVTTSSLHCTPLARKEKELINSDLNSMLVRDGFHASSDSSTPWGKAWSNYSSSPLSKGRAEFQVGASTNSTALDIDVYYYRGAGRANKALVNAIVACVQRDAPRATVKIKTTTEIFPSWLKE